MARRHSTQLFHAFYYSIILCLGVHVFMCSFQTMDTEILEGRIWPRSRSVEDMRAVVGVATGRQRNSSKHIELIDLIEQANIMSFFGGKEGVQGNPGNGTVAVNTSDPFYNIAENTKFLMEFVPKRSGKQDAPPWPRWLVELCPAVVKHFTTFPYFSRFDDQQPTNRLPYTAWFTSLYAAHSVCTAYVAQKIAAAVSADLYLHAGSHFGAVLHGGPIPWDDDVDLWMPWDRQLAFYRLCNKLNRIYPGVHVKCFKLDLCVKITLQTNESHKTRKRWCVDTTSYMYDFMYVCMYVCMYVFT